MMNVLPAMVGGFAAKLGLKYLIRFKQGIKLVNKIWDLVGKIIDGVKGWMKSSKALKALNKAADVLDTASTVVDAAETVTGCGGNSFQAGTLVLLADGTTRPIETLEVGDVVLATDPVSGTTEGHEITQLHVNNDKEFTDLTVATGNGTSAVINTTQEHPFWNMTRHAWMGAETLEPGEQLQTVDGSTVEVLTRTNYTDARIMFNLTVSTIHTYYVLAGTTPVLVHNVSVSGCRVADLTLGPDGSRPAEGITAERGDRVLAHEQEFINGSGDRNGCSSCPATVSGYADGHWTGDHSPARALAPNGPWTLYPHCKACTKQQSGVVIATNQGWYHCPSMRGGIVNGTGLGLIRL